MIQKHNIALYPTTFCILFSTQHQWCGPSAPHVLSNNTTRADRQHIY
nr:hypothetical protein [uncultured Prevotella sp.]